MTCFVPRAVRLAPELDPRQELVVLARSLWREGYCDHLAGHITYNLGDGTLLCNPWYLTWDELVPSQVIRIDLAGDLVEGDWPVPKGIPLHLALHARRPSVTWALHNHPEFATVWADIGEVPPPLDQSSALGGGEVALVGEYDGGVNDLGAAASAVERMGDADLALLAGHGVFVLAQSARALYQRACALEQRCKRAWQVRATGVDLRSPLPAWYLERSAKSDGEAFVGFWEAAIRQELRRQPDLLTC